MPRNVGEATCPRCYTTMPVEIEEPMSGCSPEANLDVTPCHADTCRVKLCPNCDQFKCESCGLAHCEEHAVLVTVEAGHVGTDGMIHPPKTEKWCPVCVKEAQEDCPNFLEELA